MSRSTFPANYPGECDDCVSSFDEGDEIGYGPDGSLLCEECHWQAWEEQ